MNWIDLILLVVVIMSITAGIQKGFIISTLDLFSWIASLTLTFLIYGPLSHALQALFPAIGYWAVPLTFLFLVTISRLIFESLTYRLIERVPLSIHHGATNKILGVLPGLVNGLIWAAIFACLLFFIPFSTTVTKANNDARLADKLVSSVSWLQDKLYPVFKEAFDFRPANQKVEVSEDKLVKLPFTVKSPKVRTDLEAQMLLMVNEERAKKGLKALRADPELRVVARKHSADMFDRGYFSHYTPEGEDPFARIRKYRVSFMSAGENLALAQTLPLAHV
ncbi:CvpA family protein, partial [Pedobacter sp.]|uniref:CvpA family protein n=1 Tax=Pedobacter sp. TaxID=1411316 RepID=UPI003D7F3084